MSEVYKGWKIETTPASGGRFKCTATNTKEKRSRFSATLPGIGKAEAAAKMYVDCAEKSQ